MGISATPVYEGAIMLPDGRLLAYSEFGDRSGAPAILLHGNPGSRLICPDADATAMAGIRLITFDRPGFGRSDPRPMHHLGDVADDLAVLTASLGIGACPVIGWSGGGPYALAIAAHRPELVSSVVLASGSAAPDDPDIEAQHAPAARALIEQLRARSEDAFARVSANFQPIADDPTRMVRLTLDNDRDPDQRLMRKPRVRSALTTMWEEAMRQGTAGLAAGWVALWALPWGFDLGELALPVTMWHGTEDRIVPFAQAERLAAAMPGAQLHGFRGEGHLIAVEHWGELLAAL